MEMKKNKISSGFTLIELLVVIAIIGILSAVVMAAVSSQRTRARVAGIQKTLSTVKVAANVCLSGPIDLNSPAIIGTTPVCTGIGNPPWPQLPSSSWVYASSTGASVSNCRDGGITTSDEFDETTADGTFQFCAYSAVDGKSIVCTQEKCTVVPYV